MVQSVEMLLDPEAERAVLEQWSHLVAAGLPSQARHTGATNRPHITLAVARVLDQDQEAAIGAAVSGSLPLGMHLGGLLVFGPGPFVLCRAVVPATDLLVLQQQVVQAVGPTAAAYGHQRVGQWTAHITLARRLTVEQLASAVQILSPVADLECEATEVRRWDSDRKLTWTVDGPAPHNHGSAGTAADHDADQVRHDHRDGAQQ